jgi:hypothetical protein
MPPYNHTDVLSAAQPKRERGPGVSDSDDRTPYHQPTHHIIMSSTK